MLAAIVIAAPCGAATQCAAASSADTPHVVELYTSEACSTCPPVDRWISQLKGKSGFVPLAFHVDYFDHVGWKDRFASAAYTRRQKESSETNGARFIYTPQVVVDGQDRKGGVDVQSLAPLPAVLTLSMQRSGDGYHAHVYSTAKEMLQVIGYWAVTEDDLSSSVTGGENAGATLHHDFVVRDYRKLRGFELAPGASVDLSYEPMLRGLPERPRSVVLVLSDAATGRPLQALRLPPC